MADVQRPRHVPIRTCIACREREEQGTLVRLVRNPDGTVQPDPDGRLPGRGAYLHARKACWELALRRATIERALRVPSIAPGDRDALMAYCLTLS